MIFPSDLIQQTWDGPLFLSKKSYRLFPNYVFLSLEVTLVLENREDPDEILHFIKVRI